MKALASLKFALLAALVVVLQACTTTPVDVLEAAQNDGQKAEAAIKVAQVYTEMATDLVNNPDTPVAVVKALGKVNDRLQPTMVELSKVYADYLVALAQWKAGEPGAYGVLLTISANLKSWVSLATSHVDAMREIIKGAK